MTETERKYFEALQPIIREKTGPWQVREDEYWNPHLCLRLRVDAVSRYYLHSDKPFPIGSRCLKSDALRLALPIDPVNPERGLWGMIDWKRWCLITHEDGNIELHDNQLIFEGIPTETLLKGLATQEGIEI